MIACSLCSREVIGDRRPDLGCRLGPKFSGVPTARSAVTTHEGKASATSAAARSPQYTCNHTRCTDSAVHLVGGARCGSAPCTPCTMCGPAVHGFLEEGQPAQVGMRKVHLPECVRGEVGRRSRRDPGEIEARSRRDRGEIEAHHAVGPRRRRRRPRASQHEPRRRTRHGVSDQPHVQSCGQRADLRRCEKV